MQQVINHQATEQGFCPHCQSPDVATEPIYVPNSEGKYMVFAGVVLVLTGLFYMWPLILLGSLLVNIGRSQTSLRAIGTQRHCNHCGQDW